MTIEKHIRHMEEDRRALIEELQIESDPERLAALEIEIDSLKTRIDDAKAERIVKVFDNWHNRMKGEL